MLMLNSYSRRTTRFSTVSPIGLLHLTAFDVAVAVYRRGSTPNVDPRADNATDLNAGFERRAAPTTVNSGSVRLVVGSPFTARRRRHTCSDGWWAAVAHCRHCGARCRHCLVATGWHRVPPTTLPTATLRFSPVRSTRAVRSDTAGLSPPPAFVSASSSLASFRPCSESEVRWLIMSSPVKSSSLDPMPTFLVREFINILLPYITKMVNSSLAAGRLPTAQKHAIVTPLLKRSGFDTADVDTAEIQRQWTTETPTVGLQVARIFFASPSTRYWGFDFES